MQKQPKVKILVGYHKPFALFKSKILIPIHGGRACSTEVSKDGQISACDLKWLQKNTIGDDTGDNLSKYNRYLNEMTSIYWAWKNQDRLGNPDYIGFMQYGKHLIFNPDVRIPEEKWMPQSEMYAYPLEKYVASNNLKSSHILSLVKQYDCLCAQKYDVTKCSEARTCRERLYELGGKENGVFEVMSEAIYKQFPAYIPYLEEIKNGSIHYPLNIFVMKKEIFTQYAEFVFGVLKYILKRVDLSQSSASEKRTPAFCSEFLTSMYISYLADNGYRVKPLKTAVIKIKKSTNRRLWYNYWKYRIFANFVWGKKRENYQDKKNEYKAKINEIEKMLKN